jgi:hypothetical protein
MGFVLDGILKKIIDTNVDVNTTYSSPAIDIDDREDDFSVQVEYSDGTGVDMSLFLEVSLNGVNYSRIIESEQIIVDDSGSHIWDVSGSGVTYMRVGIEVRSGSINVNKILYSGKRRH